MGASEAVAAGATSPSNPCANLSSLLAILRSLVALFFARLASNWSERVFSRAFSALDLWMLSISTRLFLNTLPFTFMYMSWYMCLSIFFASRYFRRSRLSTRKRRSHSTFYRVHQTRESEAKTPSFASRI